MKDFNVYCAQERTSMELYATQFGYQNCPPSHSYGPAPRHYYLIHYITSGKGVFKNKYGEYHLTSGQGFLITPNELTTVYTADDKEPWNYVWLGFNGSEAKNIISECNLSEAKPIFYKPLNGNIHCYLNAINELDMNKLSSVRALSGYMNLFFSELCTDSVTEPPSQKEITLQTAMEFIDKNIDNELNISDIAKSLFIERTTLYRLFKQKLNLSPAEYISQCRLKRARDMLIHSALTMTQIAMYNGFCSSSVFCKMFKQKYGTTPKQYRINYNSHNT